MEINSKFRIKMLLDERKVKLNKLAQMLSEKTGKRYTPDGLSHKINRSAISFDEMQAICTILGYKIKFIKQDIEI